MTEFRNAVVMGTGMMGPGIAAVLALGGLRVTLLSRTLDRAEAGVAEAHATLAFLRRHGLIDYPEQACEASEAITPGADMAGAVGKADLVIESLPENLALKQQLFRDLDLAAPPHAALCSNTSGLSITPIASQCDRHSERVLTTHFWNPPHLMPLVDVVCAERTSVPLAQSVIDLLRHCNKTPVLVRKDRPGQLGNRLHQAVVREAANIVAEGIATAEDVDLAARRGFGFRLPAYGILEHQDLVGLELCSGVVGYVAQDLYNEPQAPPIYAEKLAEGHTGAAAGNGFYDWTQGKSAADVKARRDAFLVYLLQQERRT
ncbi:3-hydroxyacyl-CoA dehydrogenase family protein [Terriglobus sp.]|uniref:3-hydroxyacyl-CoA dehydrogenase family protein n=1 Tax=Terriglobus sp. TaxID=1889013 RepID=UPI003B001550